MGYRSILGGKRLIHHRYTCVGSLIAAGLCLFTIANPAAADGNVDLPRFPSISPDGARIAFSWRGDLWTVSSDGGAATRLTTHPAEELQSAWSRDGGRIAFNSARDGALNVHVMDADGTNLRQVTVIDQSAQLAGWGVDETGAEVLTFSGVIEPDVHRSERPYMVAAMGGELRRVHDAFGSFPIVSPDGRLIAFSRGGYYYGWTRRHGRGPETQDVWLYNRADDSFTQLTARGGNDGYARWARDNRLIYMSDRELDCVNLYEMSASGERSANRLTSFDAHDIEWFDVSADGSTAVMTVWDTLYTLDLDDRRAQPRALTINAPEDEDDRYEIRSINRDVSEAALSPDGKVMAYVAYGEIFVRSIEDKSPTRRVTDSPANDRQIAWSPDGLKLYFASDRDGTESIYAASVSLSRSEVKEQFEEPEPEPVEAAAGDDESDGGEAPQREASRERDPVTGAWSGVASMPDATNPPFTMELTLDDGGSVQGRVDAEAFSGVVHGTYDADANALSLTIEGDDGSIITIEATIDNGSMSGAGEMFGSPISFVAQRSDDGDGDNGADGDPEKDEDLPPEFDPSRWHDALLFTIEPVVQTEFNDRMPTPSPDGTRLAFRRTRGDIHVIELATGDETLITESWDWFTGWQWSPDSTHIAYAQSDMNFNSEIFIVPVDGSAEPVNITKHPDNDANPNFSADGRILSFESDRVNDENDIWMVYLDPDLESLTPKELEAYYDDAVKAAGKRKPPKTYKNNGDHAEASEGAEEGEAEQGAGEDDAEEDDSDGSPAPEHVADDWDLETAYLRLRRVTTLSGAESGLAMTPGGDRYIFNGDAGGAGLFSVKWDGSDRKRLLGRVNVQHVTLTGDKVVFVSGGRAGTVAPGGGSVEYVEVSDQIRIDLEAQATQKFAEMARVLGEMFYHPHMKGVDWEGLTEQYGQLARRTRTAEEFNHVGNRLMGELTASHLGVRSQGGFTSPNSQPSGRLGTEHQRVDDGWLVTKVIEKSPAAMGPMALQVGDVITAIEGRPFADTDTVESRLAGQVGIETLITVRRADEPADAEPTELNLLITPIPWMEFRQLAYLAWRKDNLRTVEELSGGRLGYIHIQGMSQPSLDVFERDLFAAAEGRDGLIIDVRDNGGGWTTDRLLSSIMVRPHAYTIPRGADPSKTGHYPQDRLFIQRYALPMNLLCNEKSFSNAEIMSHAFKTLGRGTLVGQETWGGVISTGGFMLIDGSTVRLPFRGWYLNDGTDMENHGAVPDIIVEQTPEAESAGADEQLRAAVEDLLKRLDR